MSQSPGVSVWVTHKASSTVRYMMKIRKGNEIIKCIISNGFRTAFSSSNSSMFNVGPFLLFLGDSQTTWQPQLTVSPIKPQEIEKKHCFLLFCGICFWSLTTLINDITQNTKNWVHHNRKKALFSLTAEYFSTGLFFPVFFTLGNPNSQCYLKHKQTKVHLNIQLNKPCTRPANSCHFFHSTVANANANYKSDQ